MAKRRRRPPPKLDNIEEESQAGLPRAPFSLLVFVTRFCRSLRQSLNALFSRPFVRQICCSLDFGLAEFY